MDAFTTQLQQSFHELGRATRDAVERFQATAEQTQSAQLAHFERVGAAIDEGAAWAKASLAIGQELAQSYMRVAMSAWRRASAWDPSTFAPSGPAPSA
jgi:hypothetical protein